MRTGLLIQWMTIVAFLLFGMSAAGASPEGGQISATDFETIPSGFQGTATAISLDSDVDVSGDLAVGGQLEFGDGSVQTTAAGGQTGLYGNRIADFTPPEAYIEICFKNGGTSFDIHVIGEPTAGGACVPGDLGYIIERQERVAADWANARATCLVQGMRLLEPFEFQIACDGESPFGLIDMVNNWEWTSNDAQQLVSGSGSAGLASEIMGGGSCAHGSWGWLGRSNGNREANAYRCAL